MSGILYEASGEAGHSTSTDMREAESANGTTAVRQAAALGEVRQRGREGVTWKELAEARGWHHGQASSALSHLHHRGMVVRLEETRGRCGVYVLPEFVEFRATVQQGRRYDALTLARDVPLDTLREALRIATEPSPNERTTGEQQSSDEPTAPRAYLNDPGMDFGPNSTDREVLW